MNKLIAAATFFVAVSASAATLKETVDRTFDVKPGASVVLSNVNGGITITSWDQPRVRVVATKKVEGDRDEASQAMKDLKIQMQPRNGGLVVTTEYPDDDEGISSFFDWLSGNHVDAQVRFELTVPKSMNLDVSNTNGAITVTEVEGKHDLDTTNGRIEAKSCAGSLDARTTNGRIRAELVRVAKGEDIRLSTTNGGVSVAVPSNFAGELDAGTTNGSIHTDFPVTTTRGDNNRLRGTVNGGGSQLRVRTTNGGIEIRKL
jgi:DUF4097 and DUF4098 domain-containing protein YvlB